MKNFIYLILFMLSGLFGFSQNYSNLPTVKVHGSDCIRVDIQVFQGSYYVGGKNVSLSAMFSNNTNLWISAYTKDSSSDLGYAAANSGQKNTNDKGEATYYFPIQTTNANIVKFQMKIE